MLAITLGEHFFVKQTFYLVMELIHWKISSRA